MRSIKQALAVLLLSALLIQCLPLAARAATTWTLQSGTLTISGSGAMEDLSSPANAPWYDRRTEIKKIVVKSGVTAVGANSFTGCENVTEVSLPGSLLSIGKNAFWGCAALDTIALPASLEEIGTCAFFRSGLKSIVIPNKVTEINQGVFGQCQNLQQVTLHNNITVIRKDAFSRCYALAELTLPNNLESIGEHAFFACVLLRKLQFGQNLNHIGPAAFYGCSQLFTLVFTGNAPNLANNAFLGITAHINYPTADESWKTVAGNSYSGNITWDAGCKHNYDSFFTAPDCDSRGYTTFTCRLCGHSYVSLYVAALGHSFTQYVSDGNATIDADGTKTARCDRGCGAKDTVADPGSRLPSTLSSDVYAVGEEILRQVPVGTTAAQFTANIHQKNIRVLKDGKQVSADTPVGTGMVVQLLAGETVVGGWVIIVTGDVNGDGKLSITDMLAIKSHLLQKSSLSGIHAQAADTSGDHNISITDFIQIKAHILGKSQIKPN